MKYRKSFLLSFFLIILFMIFLNGCCMLSSPAITGNNGSQLTSQSGTAVSDTASETILDQSVTSTETSLETTTSVNESVTSQTEDSKSFTYNNDFTLKDLNDNDVALSNFAGNIVVLNFWATWCPPCRAEIPDFVEVFNTYKDRNVSFLGVSVDDDFEALKQFVSDYKINYTIVHDVGSENISGKWQVNAIPATFFLDGSGNILDSQVGQMPEEELISKIESFLK